MKPVNQKAWFLVLPVVLCVAFSAILPLMTVVNYSVQDIISPERRVFVGTEWFKSVMRDEDLLADRSERRDPVVVVAVEVGVVVAVVAFGAAVVGGIFCQGELHLAAELLDFVLSFFALVFGERLVLLLHVGLFVSVATDVANVDAAVFGVLVGQLGEFVAALSVERGDR